MRCNTSYRRTSCIPASLRHSRQGDQGMPAAVAGAFNAHHTPVSICSRLPSMPPQCKQRLPSMAFGKRLHKLSPGGVPQVVPAHAGLPACRSSLYGVVPGPALGFSQPGTCTSWYAHHSRSVAAKCHASQGVQSCRPQSPAPPPPRTSCQLRAQLPRMLLSATSVWHVKCTGA
jgi:hypothetical protein